eukprot:5685924-Amphidinium_carterae.1
MPPPMTAMSVCIEDDMTYTVRSEHRTSSAPPEFSNQKGYGEGFHGQALLAISMCFAAPRTVGCWGLEELLNLSCATR